ncbi:MAG: hypothetical protein ACR2OD_07645 [Gaiellaceae bacterium]
MADKQLTAHFDGERLAALLETLLPGNDDWPGASELDLAAAVTQRAGMAEGHAQAIERLLAALPPDFAGSTVEAREDVLRLHEGTDDFGAALLVAYDAYYVQAPVLGLLEERCGYVTRPPQPEGFELNAFDESRLAQIRKREPFWRKA